MQEGVIYNAGCRNIHFKDIHLLRDRTSTFEFHFDMDNWSRSYYPGSEAPMQSNFTFENIYTTGRLDRLITAHTPVDDIKFINSEWKSGNIGLDYPSRISGLDYPPAKIILDNITFNPSSPSNLGITDSGNKREVILEIKNSPRNTNFSLALHGNITVEASDIPYYFLK